jgi:hypothetical protein
MMAFLLMASGVALYATASYLFEHMPVTLGYLAGLCVAAALTCFSRK